jgi:hypothetical protein
MRAGTDTKSTGGLVDRLLGPRREPALEAAARALRSEAIDERLATLERAVEDLRAELRMLAGMPITVRTAVDTMATRLEQLDASVAELQAHAGQP